MYSIFTIVDSRITDFNNSPPDGLIRTFCGLTIPQLPGLLSFELSKLSEVGHTGCPYAHNAIF